MTSSSVPLTGSIVALVTPMHEDGSVDYPTLRKLIDWHIAEGTDCIGVVGTTGESPTVNVEEHCEIIRVAVEQAAKRVPIMAGCGANSTAEAIELARFAKKVGADCQLQVVPYYNKPTQEGQYQHFKAIAEAVGELPMILYNVPGRTVADLANDTTLRLAEIVAKCLPRPKPNQSHPATRSFQAIRIWVNDEFGQLIEGLEAAERALKPGGQLAVVTFHSLEDRVVKRFLLARSGRAAGGSRYAPQQDAVEPAFELRTRKSVGPDEEELADNPRSRSAKLRVAIRTEFTPAPTPRAGLGLPAPVLKGDR